MKHINPAAAHLRRRAERDGDRYSPSVSASFDTVIRAFGNNAGIEVPPEILTELGAGKRPHVQVSVGDYRFTTTIGAMSGMALISLSKARREESGLQAGQAIHVDLELAPKPS